MKPWNISRSVKDDLHFRYLDRLIVKGRSKPVEMFELVGTEADLSAEMRKGSALTKLAFNSISTASGMPQGPRSRYPRS